MQGMGASRQAADCSPAGAGLGAAPLALTVLGLPLCERVQGGDHR